MGWREVLSWGREDSLGSGPVGFNGDGSRLYLLDSRGANAARLVVLDPDSGETDVIAEDQHYDVGGAELNPESREVEAVAFVRVAHRVGRARRRRQRGLQGARLPASRRLYRGEPRPTTTAAGSWRSTPTTAPAAYFYYDREAKGGAHLFDSRSDLAEYTLSNMEPVSFAARDGLEIHGYLTLPPGASASGLPMVLNVHGGPWARDMWGYDPEAQWLANRGYACLQVNFRGSTGYGKEFVNAGDREWGAKMHDDLVDAVRWTVSEGIADPGEGRDLRRLIRRLRPRSPGRRLLRRSSGAPWTSSGPSSLITLIQSIPPYWSTLRSTFTQRVGNPETEPEFLESRSPLFYRGRHRDTDTHSARSERPTRQATGVRADRSRPPARRASTTSTCSSRTRATASPDPRTASGSTPRQKSSSLATSEAAYTKV